MKNLRKPFSICNFIFFAVFSLVASQPALPQDFAQDRFLDSFIARIAAKNKAEEHTDARKIMRADLNQDGQEDLIVLYTLENFGGGNLYRQYLAVFDNTRTNRPRLLANEVVGGKNRRQVELTSVEKSRINLTTLNYLPTDASCCPSQKGKVRLTLIKNKFKETRLSK